MRDRDHSEFQQLLELVPHTLLALSARFPMHVCICRVGGRWKPLLRSCMCEQTPPQIDKFAVQIGVSAAPFLYGAGMTQHDACRVKSIPCGQPLDRRGKRHDEGLIEHVASAGSFSVLVIHLMARSTWLLFEMTFHHASSTRIPGLSLVCPEFLRL